MASQSNSRGRAVPGGTRPLEGRVAPRQCGWDRAGRGPRGTWGGVSSSPGCGTGGGPSKECQLHAWGCLSICSLCGFIVFQNENDFVSLIIAILANPSGSDFFNPPLPTRQHCEDPRPREVAIFAQRRSGTRSRWLSHWLQSPSFQHNSTQRLTLSLS